MRKKQKIWYAFFIAILAGGYYMATEHYLSAIYTPEQLSAHADRLDGATLRGGEFPGLHLSGRTFTNTKFKKINLEGLQLSDCTFKNALFDDVVIDHCTFTNVRFENCRFINARFTCPTLTNVAFIGGEMIYSGEYEYAYDHTFFFYSKFNNVLIDNVKLRQTAFEAEGDGSIFIRNITISDRSGLNGDSLYVRIDNCTAIPGENFRSISADGADAYVTNSTFKQSGIVGTNNLFIDNSIIDGEVSARKKLVVQNSTLNAGIGGGGIWYFKNTKFVRNPEKATDLSHFEAKNMQAYVLGSPAPAYLVLHGGVVTMQDIDLPDLRITFPAQVNLKNATIRGGNWEYMKLGGGQWENVKIYPPVDITGATIKNLEGYNVTFPEGQPWQGNSGGASMTVSKTPFEWPEVHVPTPEELGLVREWPEVTGAPKGK